MNSRFEAIDFKGVDAAVARFRSFHDDYVAGIEIKFENYKGLDDDGASTGIGDADKTIILTINTLPYGTDHEQLVRVEFKGVQSFEISSPQDDGPTWGIFETRVAPDDDDELYIKWEFDFVCGNAKFLVICSKIVIFGQIS